VLKGSLEGTGPVGVGCVVNCVAVFGEAADCPSLMVILLDQGLWGCPGNFMLCYGRTVCNHCLGGRGYGGVSGLYVKEISARIDPVCWC
jgi:hypothetical protein